MCTSTIFSFFYNSCLAFCIFTRADLVNMKKWSRLQLTWNDKISWFKENRVPRRNLFAPPRSFVNIHFLWTFSRRGKRVMHGFTLENKLLTRGRLFEIDMKWMYLSLMWCWNTVLAIYKEEHYLIDLECELDVSRWCLSSPCLKSSKGGWIFCDNTRGHLCAYYSSYSPFWGITSFYV